MIDFEKELQAILNDDPLGLLKAKSKVSAVISPDNRLKASFEEINAFIDEAGHEPQKSRDVNERRLFSRLESLRGSPEKAATLLELDKHKLLDGVEAPEPFVIESIDDVIDSDPLGLLGGTDEAEPNIFDLKNLPSKSRVLTDFMAKRKPCKDFENYEDQFVVVQQELKDNRRKLIPFTDKGEAIVADNYYVLGGILLYLEATNLTSEEKTVEGKRYRKDGRTRCIFENGTESNMRYRSLAKALYQGGKIVTRTEAQISDEFQENFNQVTEEDDSSGYIYVLKSLSDNAEIQSFQHLYKVGFSTTSVEERVANAENEPTYLMAPVRIVAEYETYNMNTQKFEHLLHKFFADVCLDLKVSDNNGKMHQPREWFIAPLEIIDQAINFIVNEQIQYYQYDAGLKNIVPL